jgi:aspartyl-tRNA synthetase
MLRTHTCNELDEKDIGKTVKICGWADTIREHGKIIFVDLRDRYGQIQTIVIAKNKDVFETMKTLPKESAILIEGKVQARPKGTENNKMPTGKIEVFVEKVGVFNKCPALPFEFSDKNVNEEVRLKYRFLDLRREDMQRYIALRHKIIKSFRDFFDKEGFLEIETPLLAKSTPEGARDYVVPSRIHAGKFYALPQSPQIFKQLLMVAGFDKYFQIAKCMRDEDLRADRQPEFTQLDAEMSFVDEEDSYSMVERALKHALKQSLNIDLKIPFHRISYADSMKKYKSDKPDLRKNKDDSDELAFVWVVDFPVFEYNEEEKKLTYAHNPFAMPKEIEKLDGNQKELLNLKARTYDLVLNGIELLSGSVRNHDSLVQRKIFKILGLNEKEIEEKFGFMLNALSYGAPQHGGFAIGLDRLIQILIKAPSIREVIAFPKNKEARDVMLDAPSELSEKQLKDIHISIGKEEKAKIDAKKSSKRKK